MNVTSIMHKSADPFTNGDSTVSLFFSLLLLQVHVKRFHAQNMAGSANMMHKQDRSARLGKQPGTTNS